MNVFVVDPDAIEPGGADRTIHMIPFPASLAPHVDTPSGVTRDGHVPVQVTLVFMTPHPTRHDHGMTIDLTRCFEALQEFHLGSDVAPTNTSKLDKREVFTRPRHLLLRLCIEPPSNNDHRREYHSTR